MLRDAMASRRAAWRACPIPSNSTATTKGRNAPFAVTVERQLAFALPAPFGVRAGFRRTAEMPSGETPVALRIGAGAGESL
jgi:hypothetical protein